MRTSFLTKPSIVVDEVLSQLCGIPVGEQISYTTLTKGLHSYIRAKNLRIPKSKDEEVKAVPESPAAEIPSNTTEDKPCSVSPGAQVALPVLSWPRRCRQCFDRLANQEKSDKHFTDFHKEVFVTDVTDPKFVVEHTVEVDA